MSRRSRRYWSGRPNPPPLNWNQPDRPVVRSVSASPDDFPLDQPEREKREQADSQSIPVSLTCGDWFRIVEALDHYSRLHAGEEQQKWHQKARASILGVANPHYPKKEPVAVRLPIEDWRLIWLNVRTARQELGGDWPAWFGSLTKTMTAQIKGP
jgi:hypothetical protein